jgi:hypothetical protein
MFFILYLVAGFLTFFLGEVASVHPDLPEKEKLDYQSLKPFTRVILLVGLWPVILIIVLYNYISNKK